MSPFTCDPEEKWDIVSEGCSAFFCKVGKLPPIPAITTPEHYIFSQVLPNFFLIIHILMHIIFVAQQHTPPVQGFSPGKHTTTISGKTCHPKERVQLLKLN